MWIGERSSTCVLTTERLRLDSGMLRKKAETLDLCGVKDVSVKKSMTQRTRTRQHRLFGEQQGCSLQGLRDSY